MSERKPLLSDPYKLLDEEHLKTMFFRRSFSDDEIWAANKIIDFYEDLIASGKLQVVEDPKDTHFKTQQKSLEILRDGGKQLALRIGDMMHSKLFDKNGIEHPIFSFHAGFPVHELRVVEEAELVWRVDGRSIGGHYCSVCNRRHPATVGAPPSYYCPGCGGKIKQDEQA